MGFKDIKAAFEKRSGFRDELARFTGHEAAMFSPSKGEEEETASARVDASFEKALNLSAQKNKTRIQEGRAEQKELKSLEHVMQNAEIKKKLKKSISKEQKKMGAKLAAGKMLSAKGSLSNELGGGRQSSGDAFSDGTSGLVGTVLSVIRPSHYAKKLAGRIAAAIVPSAMLFLAFGVIFVIFTALLFDVMSPMADVKDALDSVISIFTEDKIFSNASFSQSEIDDIVSKITCDETEEKVIRFALSKVGYPYSQDMRTSGTHYDCSSLAYYAWKEAGVDISFGGGYPPTAAEGARMLNEKGMSVAGEDVAGFSLQPGDLVYYGGSDNGRYKGIYHVAIYLGNGCAVEALNTKYGVVYQTLRTENAIMICRPK